MRLHRLLFVLTILTLASCASNTGEEGPVLGHVIGDFAKCANPEEQAHPDCYCHELAIARYPERVGNCEVDTREIYVEVFEAGSCANPYVNLESLSSIVDRKREFCKFNENWDRASCYCYEPVVAFMPERKNFCASLVKGRLAQVLAPYQARTGEWLSAFRQNTYWTEFSVSEKSEEWADNTVAYLNQELIFDDCDAVDSLLDLAFGIGGFELFELSKILVDTNPEDDVLADHYVGAVWVSNAWRYIEISSQETNPLEYIEIVGVQDSSGAVNPANIVAYRRLDQSQWHQGMPPAMNYADTFCPVNPDLLFSRTRSLM